MPGHVREVAVGGNRVDFATELFEGVVVVSEVFEFGRADEGEVGRVEEHHGPLAFEFLVGDLNEVVVEVGLCLKRQHGRTKKRHC